MNAKNTVGIGLGGAVLTGALATCPIAQAAVLGTLGALGFMPFMERLRPVLFLVALGFCALAIYGLARTRRRRPADAPRTAGIGQSLP